MALSQDDRESLLARVERKLARRVGSGELPRETLRATVGRVCSAVDSSGIPVQEQHALVVLSAASTPDLASRLRRSLAGAVDDRLLLFDVGAATVGRHTVVAVRTNAAGRDQLLALAQQHAWRAWSAQTPTGDLA